MAYPIVMWLLCSESIVFVQKVCCHFVFVLYSYQDIFISMNCIHSYLCFSVCCWHKIFSVQLCSEYKQITKAMGWSWDPHWSLHDQTRDLWCSRWCYQSVVECDWLWWWIVRNSRQFSFNRNEDFLPFLLQRYSVCKNVYTFHTSGKDFYSSDYHSLWLGDDMVSNSVKLLWSVEVLG